MTAEGDRERTKRVEKRKDAARSAVEGQGAISISRVLESGRQPIRGGDLPRAADHRL